MTTFTRSPAVRDGAAHPGTAGTAPLSRSRPTLLAVTAVPIACALGYVTLGPPGVVADARAAAVSTVQALLGPWVGTVHRAVVENVANALLFLPVGVLAGLALVRRGRLLPVLAGAGLSAAVEGAQLLLPGRVPDPVDVAMNTVGTALGVALVTSPRAVSRLQAARARHYGPLRAGLLAVPVLAALAACQPAGGRGPDLRAVDGRSPTLSAAGALTAADGWVPDGRSVSPFADVPAVTGLDPALRQALQDAARAATADGVKMYVTSGWRSAAYQQALFDAAVAAHGSVEAASQYVLSPEESEHVKGRAVDVGPTDATSWMAQHGSDHGLCQTYGNEMWHFEHTVTRGDTCPAPATDASAG